MKKLLFILILGGLVFAPQLSWAHPGPIDQYGGHYEFGEYHYHNIPLYPNYASGRITKTADFIFYFPQVKKDLLIYQPDSLENQQKVYSKLLLDLQHCQDSQIFAPGKYNDQDKVRIRPVCANQDNIVKTNELISPDNYFKEIKVEAEDQVKKVYHYETNPDGKQVFTDRPEFEELKGKIIQGETDQAMYLVQKNIGYYELRKVSDSKAKSRLGQDWQEQVLYFDDSIVYSYKIGKAL